MSLYWCVNYGLDTDTLGFYKKEVKDEGEHYSIILDAPGVKVEDVSLTVVAGILKYEAKRFDKKETYERNFVMPTDALVDDIEADLKHGVLTMKIKKIKPKVIKVNVK
jgi:HSP20 family molecular chaperone IbpA